MAFLETTHVLNVCCLYCTEIAEANPNKFRLDYGELESRKQFIRDTRAVIKVSGCPLVRESFVVEVIWVN